MRHGTRHGIAARIGRGDCLAVVRDRHGQKRRHSRRRNDARRPVVGLIQALQRHLRLRLGNGQRARGLTLKHHIHHGAGHGVATRVRRCNGTAVVRDVDGQSGGCGRDAHLACRAVILLRQPREHDRGRSLGDGKGIGDIRSRRPIAVSGLRGSHADRARCREGQVGAGVDLRVPGVQRKAHRQPGRGGGEQVHDVGRQLVARIGEVDRLRADRGGEGALLPVHDAQVIACPGPGIVVCQGRQRTQDTHEGAGPLPVRGVGIGHRGRRGVAPAHAAFRERRAAVGRHFAPAHRIGAGDVRDRRRGHGRLLEIAERVGRDRPAVGEGVDHDVTVGG